jgi:hypothetical protein
MSKSSSELATKKAIGFVWLAVVCFFNTLPLAVISILANISAVRFFLSPFYPSSESADNDDDSAPGYCTVFAKFHSVLVPGLTLDLCPRIRCAPARRTSAFRLDLAEDHEVVERVSPVSRILCVTLSAYAHVDTKVH